MVPEAGEMVEKFALFKKGGVPFLKIAYTMYIHNFIKNLFDFALVRLK